MRLIHEANRIYAADDAGETIAEITFPMRDGVADINHTFVDDSLRGQGVADKLVRAAAEQIRSAGWPARATCPYASKWFRQHPEEAGILTPDAR